MLCEKCHQREAVVKFTQVIGTEKKTLNICDVCAEKQGLSNPMVDISKVFGKIIIAILSEYLASQTSQTVSEKDKKEVCKECGLSWADFKLTGRLGCPACYNTFVEHMKMLLRRIHGNNRHIGKPLGKHPKEKEETIRSLRKKLQKYICEENYEGAAELRDRIRKLEQKK